MRKCDSRARRKLSQSVDRSPLPEAALAGPEPSAEIRGVDVATVERPKPFACCSPLLAGAGMVPSEARRAKAKSGAEPATLGPASVLRRQKG